MVPREAWKPDPEMWVLPPGALHRYLKVNRRLGVLGSSLHHTASLAAVQHGG